jgi:hypothetical protein
MMFRELIFFVFGGTGVWTRGFALARKVLYHFSHTPSSFCSVYFADRVSLFSGLTWTMILLFYTSAIAGMTGVPQHSQASFQWDGVSWTFLFRLARNPDFSLLCSLGWQEPTTVPSGWLRWHLTNFLPRLASNCNPSYLSLPNRIIGVSHGHPAQKVNFNFKYSHRGKRLTNKLYKIYSRNILSREFQLHWQ